jgi:hypothetical protein
MKKEFVPYELALELKQLGFDEPCLAGYSTSTEKLEYYSRPIVTKDSFTVDAPTFSQAFRWFREEYELFHSTNYQDDNSGPGGFDYEILNKRGKSQGDDEVPEFGTYEEAELDCLQKLIEIVKTK